MKLYIFYLLAVIAVLSSLMVITRRNVIHSAIFLIAMLLSVAGIYFLLEAEFLAVVQILIYAGAIITMFVFVIMAIGSSKVKERYGFRTFTLSVLGLFLLVELIYIFRQAMFYGLKQGLSAERIAASGGNVQIIGKVLIEDFLFPFEILSFILLAAMIGVFVLTKRKEPDDIEEGEV